MIVKYSTFLNVLKNYFEIRKLKDYKEPSSKSICLLRHDIDRHMSSALRMAQTEYSLDVQSTYFFLSSAKYYEDEMFIENCLKLQDMGHEIGLHNNALTVAVKTECDPRTVFEKELKYLRENGIKVFGTSAHGDYACRRFAYTNYEIFKECITPYKQMPILFRPKFLYLKHRLDKITLHNLELSDYSLYEAYFLPRDFYLTDCRGTWRCIEGKGDEWQPNFQKSSPQVDDVLKFLKKISSNKVTLQALLHPSVMLIDIYEDETL